MRCNPLSCRQWHTPTARRTAAASPPPLACACSYYTRQLALRPAGAGNELQQEGEKTVQKTVARRTIDYAGPYVTWFEVGCGCPLAC